MQIEIVSVDQLCEKVFNSRVDYVNFVEDNF